MSILPCGIEIEYQTLQLRPDLLHLHAAGLQPLLDRLRTKVGPSMISIRRLFSLVTHAAMSLVKIAACWTQCPLQGYTNSLIWNFSRPIAGSLKDVFTRLFPVALRPHDGIHKGEIGRDLLVNRKSELYPEQTFLIA